MLTVIGKVGMTAGAAQPVTDRPPVRRPMVCTGFRGRRHCGRHAGEVQGSTRGLRGVPGTTSANGSDSAVFAENQPSGCHWRPRQAYCGGGAVLPRTGGLVSYGRPEPEGVGLSCDVGIAERTERLMIGLAAIGLAELGSVCHFCSN